MHCFVFLSLLSHYSTAVFTQVPFFDRKAKGVKGLGPFSDLCTLANMNRLFSIVGQALQSASRSLKANNRSEPTSMVGRITPKIKSLSLSSCHLVWFNCILIQPESGISLNIETNIVWHGYSLDKTAVFKDFLYQISIDFCLGLSTMYRQAFNITIVVVHPLHFFTLQIA